MDIEKKKVRTPKFRVSYPHVFKPTKMKDQPESEAKYGLVMLFDKGTVITDLARAVHNAAVEKWGEDKTKWPKKIRMPFRDGDEDEGVDGKPEYKNHIFVGARSKKKPGIVDGRLQPIESEEEFYAGCYARATLIAFAYDTAGNRGVSFALQNIQKLAEGERIGGGRPAAQDFDAVEDTSEDAENYTDITDYVFE